MIFFEALRDEGESKLAMLVGLFSECVDSSKSVACEQCYFAMVEHVYADGGP